MAAFSPHALPDEPSPSGMKISDAQRARIAAVMDAIAANGQYSGTFLVSVGDELIHAGAFGLADIEHGVPNTLDTQFRIASATKPFTTLLVYQLADSGKLKLDDKLSDWVPEYPAEKGAKITVLQLLTHTSGITGEWRIPELGQIERHRWTRDELLAEIGGRKLVFEPGTRNAYSNYGYYLLGEIIERAGGAGGIVTVITSAPEAGIGAKEKEPRKGKARYQSPKGVGMGELRNPANDT
jgi:CubicO group peptidase (beta-lactamase class C family)